MVNARSGLSISLAVLLLVSVSGCAAISYYSQAVSGQWKILRARQPVDEQLRKGELPAATLTQLQLSQRVLQFAADRLDMPADGRYSTYVELGREYVVWNVFAAGPYDLAGRQWCYPFVGCAPYRGYFRREQALAAAGRYQAEGLETYVGGVPAYSTLGWFEDPLLSSFLGWPEADLVQLLLHELAHGKVWVRGDVAFNESFASFVGEQGARLWFEAEGRGGAWLEYQEGRRHWRRFRDFLLSAKQQLTEVYNSDVEGLRAAGKQRVLAALQSCYQQYKPQLGGGRFDAVMAGLNNAYLVSLGTYEDWVPAFRGLYLQAQGNWPAYFQQVQALGRLDPAARRLRLEQLSAAGSEVAEQQEAEQRNHQHPQQVHCQAL